MASTTRPPRTPRSLAVSAIPDPRARDIAIMMGVLVAEVVAALAGPWPEGIGGLSAGVVLLIGLSVMALWWRRTHPIAVTLFASAVAVTLSASEVSGGTHLTVLVGVFSVGLYESSRHRSQGTALFVALLGALHGFLEFGAERDPSIEQLLVGFTVPAVVWFAGDRIRGREGYLGLLEDRAERSQRETEAETERAVAEERARIARELHDIVAHRVSMMIVQANAARTVAASDPRRAGVAMQAVTDAGKQALSELRSLLNVLRPEPNAQPEAPQPGLSDVEALVAGVARTDLAVTYKVTGHSEPLPTAVGLSTYRIIQEALTNALKYAGPTATVEVTLDQSPDEIVVTIIDDGHGPPTTPSPTPVGHGIIGMKERVALFGGHFEAGGHAGGGFRIAATIPTGGHRG